MATVVVLPTGIGSTSNWANDFGGNKYDVVASDDDDTSYLRTNASGAVSQYFTKDAIGGIATVASVKGRVNIKLHAASGRIRFDVSTADEATHSYSANITATASYVETTTAALNNPYSGDANWTPADLNNAHIGGEESLGQTRVSYLVMVAEYILSAGGFAMLLASVFPLFGSMSHGLSLRDVMEACRSLNPAPTLKEECERIRNAALIRPAWSF